MCLKPKVYLIVVCLLSLFFFRRVVSGKEEISLSMQENQTKEILESKSHAYRIDDVLQIEKKGIKQRFNDCLVIGDSLVEGLYAYGVLDENQCVGIRGARTDLMDEAFKQVKAKKPKIVFLNYGMNDLEYVGGNTERFIQTYQDKIHTLKSIAPNVQIYVNAILPMTQQAMNRKPVYQKYTEFNVALKKMCTEEKISFIDQTYLASNIKYGKDGIHPTKPYYGLWADLMAREAGR